MTFDFDPIADPKNYSVQLIEQIHAEMEIHKQLKQRGIKTEGLLNGIDPLFIQATVNQLDRLSEADVYTVMQHFADNDPDLAKLFIPEFQNELKRVKDPKWYEHYERYYFYV